MFVDYYAILGIDEKADLETVKSAYRREAVKWHPDKNIGQDTTKRMQLINAACFILSDPEARVAYDIEYQRFKTSNVHEILIRKKERNSYEKKQTEEKYTYDFNIENEQLTKWINNAMKQSLELARNTYSMTTGGIKEATKGAVFVLVFQIALALIGIILAFIIGLI